MLIFVIFASSKIFEQCFPGLLTLLCSSSSLSLSSSSSSSSSPSHKSKQSLLLFQRQDDDNAVRDNGGGTFNNVGGTNGELPDEDANNNVFLVELFIAATVTVVVPRSIFSVVVT